jgi:hypothetical protein
MKKSITHNTHNTNSKIATVGLDFAKNSFALHGFDDAGKTVLTKDLKRGITVPVHLTLCTIALTPKHPARALVQSSIYPVSMTPVLSGVHEACHFD